MTSPPQGNGSSPVIINIGANSDTTALNNQQNGNNMISDDITLKPNFYCCSLTVCYEGNEDENKIIIQLRNINNSLIEQIVGKKIFKNVNLCEKYIIKVISDEEIIATTIYDPSKYIYWENCY